jgi:hypothetical protein
MKTRYLQPPVIKPSYSSEHRRMKPVIEMARKLFIASNPEPQALYEPGSAGFQIWCTHEDNPGGFWSDIQMTQGAFPKPAEFVASVHWRWDDEAIVGLELSTTAYALADQFPKVFSSSPIAKKIGKQSIYNRKEDLAWARRKVAYLFQQTTVRMPIIYVTEN